VTANKPATGTLLVAPTGSGECTVKGKTFGKTASKASA
jgi:hypothetical protein